LTGIFGVVIDDVVDAIVISGGASGAVAVLILAISALLFLALLEHAVQVGKTICRRTQRSLRVGRCTTDNDGPGRCPTTDEMTIGIVNGGNDPWGYADNRKGG